MSAEAGEFSLIVSSVESAGLPEAARKFAEAFSLDEQIATQICKSAPIIFAQKLTKSEVKSITPVLGDLSKTGIDFRVTARVAGKLPKVNWPVRPQFTAGGSGAGLAFDWDNNAFVCPGCGDSFLFRRLGKIKLAEPVSASAGNGSEMTESKAAATKATAKAVAGGYTEEQPSAPTAVGVEGVEPLAGEGESLDLPETVEELNLDALPDIAPEEPAPLMETEDLLPEPAPLEEPGFADGGEFTAATEEPAPVAEPEPVAAPEPEVEAVPEGELYNVFLSKITDTSKRDKAAELIAKVKGCTGPEAKELTTRLVIPLAKNVAKAKAEDILNQFKKLKIFGRMTKVK
jgi:ribosomal protein L7/L12